MTTLPQTTTVRLPRPQGHTPLAMPAPGTATSSFQMNGGDVLRVIRSNMLLIFIVMVLAVAGGWGLNIYLLRYHAKYTATGYAQIVPPTKFQVVDDRPTYVDTATLSIDQRTQAQILKHESLFVRVLQNANGEIRKTRWFGSFKGNVFRAKDDLVDNFRVNPIPESRLISVEMSYSDPKDCKTIVEEILNTHLEEQKQLAVNKTLERSIILNNMKQRLQFRRDELQREMREKAQQLSIDGMQVSGRVGVKEVELQDLMRAQFDVTSNRDQAKAAYEAAAAQVADGQDLPMVVEETAKDPEVANLKFQVSNLELRVSEYASLGPGHKEYIKARQMLDTNQKRLEDAQSTVRAKVTTRVLEGLRQQVSMTENQLKTLSDKVDSAKADLGSLTNNMNQYLTVKDDEQTTRELLKKVTDELDQIGQNTGSTTQASIQWATRPETPDSPSFPKLPYVLAIAIAAGLALSLGIAFLRELMDTSVRSPRDIARVGQLNLLGIIPHEDDDPQAAGAPLPTVIFQAPHSMLAEQFRQVRSRLQHVASLDSTRSIMVTSPSPGDGKSTVAANLAAGLALNGRRILLVDANFRRPELHKMFALPNDAGFSAVLNSIDNFSTAVCQTQVPNLDVLPSGPRPSNATELLESQLLIDFIERALEEYDHVVFDSGPFLFVSESVALAPRVDGVITVVRARANSRGLLQRLRDDLRKSKAEHLGVVLNAVRAQAGGYYTRNMKTYYAYSNGHEG